MFHAVLVAIDLAEKPAAFVLAKAQSLVEAGGTIIVTHVVEPQQVQYSFDPTFTGSITRALEEEAVERSAGRVAELCRAAGLGDVEQIVTLGRPAQVIHELAADRGVDAIVMGSHGVGGWKRLLGSTANAVLHGSPVTVLVARLPEDA